MHKSPWLILTLEWSRRQSPPARSRGPLGTHAITGQFEGILGTCPTGHHPIYSGLFLGAIGWGLVAGSTVTIAALVCCFSCSQKSVREEASLLAVHPEYSAYQRRTKRLIPWIYSWPPRHSPRRRDRGDPG